MKKLFQISIFSLVAYIIFGSAFLFALPVQAGNSHNMTGFAWSDNIGWISFNNLSGGGSSDYGVNVLETGPNKDYLEGYAWNDNIGWIKFDPTFTGPSGATDAHGARIENDNVTITGWARACKGTANGTCTGVNGGLGRSDGWDGWIKLGTGWTNSVSVYNQDTLRGYGWSDLVTGWIDFDATFNTMYAVRIPSREDPDFIAYTPTLSGDQIFNQPGNYAFNRPLTIQGNIRNLGGTTKSSQSFIAGFFDPDNSIAATEVLIAPPFPKNDWRTITYPTSGTWLPAVGSYSRKLCADMSPPNINAVPEQNEFNNCSPIVSFAVKQWGNLRIQTVLSGVCGAPTFTVDSIEGTTSLSGGTTRVTWNYVSAAPGDNEHIVALSYGNGRAPKNISRQSCSSTDFTSCGAATPVPLGSMSVDTDERVVLITESLAPATSVIYNAEYPCATVNLDVRYDGTTDPWVNSLTVKPDAEAIEFRWLSAGNYDMDNTDCEAKSPPTAGNLQGTSNELGDFSGTLNPLCPRQPGGTYCTADGDEVGQPKRYYITCADTSAGFKADNIFFNFVDIQSLPRFQEF